MTSQPRPDPATIYYIANQNMGMHLNPFAENTIGDVLANAEAQPQSLGFRAVTLNRPKPGTCFVAIVPPNPEDGYFWQDQDQIKKIKLPNGRELEVISRDQGYAYPENTFCTVSKKLYKLVNATSSKVFFVHYLPADSNVRAIPVNTAIAQSILSARDKRKKMQQQTSSLDVKVPPSARTAQSHLTPQQQMHMHQQMIAQQQAQFQMQQAQLQQQHNQDSDDKTNDETDCITVKEIAEKRFNYNQTLMKEIFTISSTDEFAKEVKPIFSKAHDAAKLKEQVEKIEMEMKLMKESHSKKIKDIKESSRDAYDDISMLSELKSSKELDAALKQFAVKNKMKVVPCHQAMKIRINAEGLQAMDLS